MTQSGGPRHGLRISLQNEASQSHIAQLFQGRAQGQKIGIAHARRARGQAGDGFGQGYMGTPLDGGDLGLGARDDSMARDVQFVFGIRAQQGSQNGRGQILQGGQIDTRLELNGFDRHGIENGRWHLPGLQGGCRETTATGGTRTLVQKDDGKALVFIIFDHHIVPGIFFPRHQGRTARGLLLRHEGRKLSMELFPMRDNVRIVLYH
mmetsp:Transcript_28677/g.59933  ORF Transcript_28677/g.59933 Transcript_28677/m.59933 type:complete len:207 (-) Transcript_28677:361-981(-)